MRHQRERYQRIHALSDAGGRVSDIARQTGLDRTTVRKYLRAAEPPTATARGPSPHLLDAFQPLLAQLWAQGQRKGPALLAALQAAGFRGSQTTVLRWLRQRRHQATPQRTAAPRIVFAPRTWVAWFLARWPYLPRASTTPLSQLLTQPAYRHVFTLVHQFHTMLGHRQGQALTAWVAQAKASTVPEFVRFAEGLEADREAVENGPSLPWSQRMTEGFNHQIKCLKRVMYGRAHFPLLRARILHNQS